MMRRLTVEERELLVMGQRALREVVADAGAPKEGDVAWFTWGRRVPAGRRLALAEPLLAEVIDELVLGRRWGG